jgi:cytochrome P450
LKHHPCTLEQGEGVNPLSAVTHPDPYPYYTQLALEPAPYFDTTLNLWVASSAAAVTEALRSDLCRVRPPSEPVPRTLEGSVLGAVFARLIRMNDGANHCPFKGAVRSTLTDLHIDERAAFWAQRFARADDAQHWRDLMFSLPVCVVADQLGIRADALPQVVAWTRDFVRGIAPNADADTLERGNRAALGLLEVLRDVLRTERAGLLTTLARTAPDADLETVLANGIGLLMQSFEATAGLIGNSLVALRRRPNLLEDILDQPALLRAFVAEVSRFDPSVQNTRRFVARDGVIAGQAVKVGEAMLVVLAAANRDPSVNPNPERFDLTRADPRVFTFGSGVHACPGTTIAENIAQAALEAWMAEGFHLETIPDAVTYQPSFNTRIPIF